MVFNHSERKLGIKNRIEVSNYKLRLKQLIRYPDYIFDTFDSFYYLIHDFIQVTKIDIGFDHFIFFGYCCYQIKGHFLIVLSEFDYEYLKYFLFSTLLFCIYWYCQVLVIVENRNLFFKSTILHNIITFKLFCTKHYFHSVNHFEQNSNRNDASNAFCGFMNILTKLCKSNIQSHCPYANFLPASLSSKVFNFITCCRLERT